MCCSKEDDGNRMYHSAMFQFGGGEDFAWTERPERLAVPRSGHAAVLLRSGNLCTERPARLSRSR